MKDSSIESRIIELSDKSVEYHHRLDDQPTKYTIGDKIKPNADWIELIIENPFLEWLPHKTYHIIGFRKLIYETPAGKIETLLAALNDNEEIAVKYITHAAQQTRKKRQATAPTDQSRTEENTAPETQYQSPTNQHPELELLEPALLPPTEPTTTQTPH